MNTSTTFRHSTDELETWRRVVEILDAKTPGTLKLSGLIRDLLNKESARVLKNSPRKRKDATQAENIQKAWDGFAKARAWRVGQGIVIPGGEPELTEGLKNRLVKAAKAHGWQNVIDAGKGLFVSEWHCANPEHLRPEIAWKNSNDFESVLRFATLYRSAKGRG